MHSKLELTDFLKNHCEKSEDVQKNYHHRQHLSVFKFHLYLFHFHLIACTREDRKSIKKISSSYNLKMDLYAKWQQVSPLFWIFG